MQIIGDGGHAKVVREIISQLGQEPTGIIIAVGDNAVRKKEAARFSQFFSAIHPRAVIAQDVTIGEGAVIAAGAIVSTATRIGRHVIINTGASVDHDCIIEDFVHVGPGVRLCGGVHVREGALIGVGSAVIPKIQIGAWALVGAGSVVIRNVPDFARVFGNPAHSGKSSGNR